jgi:DNA polymerase-3 subunit epsilon
MSLGIHDRVSDSALILRARQALSAGPLNAVALMESVCSLPGAPVRVAERLAEALFARHAEFARDGEGRWVLASARRAANTAPLHPFSALMPAEPPPAATIGAQPGRAVREAAPNAAAVAPLRGIRFAVVDVETTGSSVKNGADRVTEIAVVHVDGGEVTDVYETLVNPERPIPPSVVALTRITWEMVKDAPRFADVSPHVVHQLRERVFVAHNAGFDWRFVTWEVKRASGVHLAGERLCTVRMARALLPQLPRRTLDCVTNYFGVTNTARHRAGGDAIATAHCFARLLRVAEDRGIETWESLVALLAPGTGRRKRRRRSAWPRSVDVDPTI